MYHSGENPWPSGEDFSILSLHTKSEGMQNYRKTSHTTYDCKYHVVWITKYRKKVLTGIVAELVPELIRGICKEHEVEILKGHMSKDHVHLFVSVPPHVTISKLVQYLKGKSSYKLLSENKDLSRAFWAAICGVGQISC